MFFIVKLYSLKFVAQMIPLTTIMESLLINNIVELFTQNIYLYNI